MSSVWSSDALGGCSVWPREDGCHDGGVDDDDAKHVRAAREARWDQLDTNYVERMQALAARWDLRALQQEPFEAMGETPEGQRVYAPSQLALALDRFLDSYGGKPDSERGG